MTYEYLIFAGILIVIALAFFLVLSFKISRSLEEISALWNAYEKVAEGMDDQENYMDETYNEMMNLKMKVAVLQSRLDFEPAGEITYKRGPGRPPKE